VRESIFELSIVARSGTLFVLLQVPSETNEQEIEAVKGRVATAFALIEKVAEAELQLLHWEKQSTKDQEDRYLLSRPYSDPSYPTRFASALQFFSPEPLRMRRH
jgi:hypothetical protein